MRIFDFATTLDNTSGRITKSFLAKSLGRTYATINNWYNGGRIPFNAETRLVDILRNNEVKLYYKNLIT